MIRSRNHIRFHTLNRDFSNVLKMNENERTITISLDAERSGLSWTYHQINHLMKQVYRKMEMYNWFMCDVVDLDSFSDSYVDGHCIVLIKNLY